MNRDTPKHDSQSATFRTFFVLNWKNMANLVWVLFSIPIFVLVFFYGLPFVVERAEFIFPNFYAGAYTIYIFAYYIVLSSVFLSGLAYQSHIAMKIFESASIRFKAPNGEIFAINQQYHILSTRAFGSIVQKNSWIADIKYNPDNRRLKIITLYKVLKPWGAGLRFQTDSGSITLPDQIDPQQLISKIGPAQRKLFRQ